MTQTNDPPLVASVALIPDSDEKADLDAPSDESGKLVVSQAPNITITSTSVVADQAERLALDPQEGDIAIQQDTTESFIFTGGANELANWQLVQFDAVGGISGEDIAPRDIDGRNVTLTDLSVNGLLNGADTSGAAAGEALTSNGSGSFQFASVGGGQILRNGSEIEYVALDIANLPAANNTGDVGLVTSTNEYVEDSISGVPFDIASASFTKSINNQGDSQARGLSLSPDGTRLYEVVRDTAKIHQSSLSTPFDIGSATLQKSINTQNSFPSGLTLSPDGTRLYEVNFGPITQLTLSTPFDIASATFEKEITLESGGITGVEFSPDGTQFYEIGKFAEKIYQFSLSTPFDLASATNTQKSINTQSSESNDLAIKADGTRLYEVGGNEIFQSSLSTPFDLASATFVKSISSQDPGPTGIDWKDDGSRLYEIGANQGKIYQLQVTVDEWQTI